MSVSLPNKKLRKWRKARCKLEKDGLAVTDDSSSSIALANGGLGNGIDNQQLLDELEKFGKLTCLISRSNKPYAVATFNDVESARKCFEKLQGYRLLKSAENNYSVLYVFFLQCVPLHMQGDFDDSTSVLLDSSSLPSGLLQYEDFISAQEEQYLVEQIENDIRTLSAEHIQEDLKQRTVVHYGYKFRYGSNDVDCLNPLSNDGLPEFSQSLIKKLLFTGQFQNKPDQLTINKYEPGDGIPPHIDNPVAFAEPLATLSLGSPVIMEMKSPDGKKVSILLKPRTLILFTKDSRYLWTHGIQARKTDVVYYESSKVPSLLKRSTRISMTFRKVLPATEQSAITFSPKSSESKSSLPTTNHEAIGFENKLVHNVYDNIAQHFSCTREKPWPKVVEFLKSLYPGSFVIDVGCGSGRYLNVNRDIFMLGCDYCSPLVTISAEKHDFVFTCDGLNLPVRSGVFDAAICIAVIHHYSTLQRQLSAVNELLRVIRSGGLCLIYVWAAEQKRNNIDSSYLKKNSHAGDSKVRGESTHQPDTEASCLVVHKNRTEFLQQDVLVPWKTKSNVSKALLEKFGDEAGHADATYYRFYHVFKQNELESLCASIPNVSIVTSYYDNGNWSVILKKN